MSRKPFWRLAKGRPALACGVFAFVLLAGCAENPTTTEPPRRSAMTERCSARAVVFIRQGANIRNDFELVELGRRMGITLDVLQTMGRNTKVIMIRSIGSQAACESALDQLKDDPRIESIQR